jgi:two-component system KDP operon response regulator KdpE
VSDYLATVLLVEDDREIRRFLHTALGVEGYKVVESANARRGEIDASTHKPDIAIVDLGLPDYDGLEVIRGIRQWSGMPILVLSARSREHAKLEAFEAGADDYVTKPFGVGELLARVRVALRHRVQAPAGGTVLRLGPCVIDLEARRATREGVEVHLTPIEFRLVASLARHLGGVVAHKQLLAEVWGPTHQADTHYLRIYLKRLRDKLEADPMRPKHFLTETGVGYRLVSDD